MKDIQLLKGMLTSGVNNLYNHYPHMDKLNVFPVPDGDTGTNMNLTCTNGFAEISKNNFDSFYGLISKFARGLIMGARGNSGVIFSQIMKGFANGMKDKEKLDIPTWKDALDNAHKVAYAAVMKPVEGTILTVMRETSELASKLDDSISIIDFFENICKFSNDSLERTPDLLPALKEVGVVDSGGYGLVKFFEGMYKFAKTGKPIAKLKKLEENHGANLNMKLDEMEFGYCTEAIIILEEKWISQLQVSYVRLQFEEFGNTSIVAVKDEDILKIHTHAQSPGQVLTYLQQFGEFKTVKVENMSLQADEQVIGGKPKANKSKNLADHIDIKVKRDLVNEVATIGVVSSNKLADYFKKELNMDYVINAGSKMNPSTSDFLKAIELVDAKQVFIFPNDKNIILAAKQAKELEKKSKIIIVHSTTIPQGMAAFLNFDPEESSKKNESNLAKVLKNVVSFQTTIASKDAVINGVKVKENQYLGIADRKIVFAGENLFDVFLKSLSKYITSKTEIITIFTGADATNKDVIDLRKFLDENCDVEYEIIDGGQETYSFIMSIE